MDNHNLNKLGFVVPIAVSFLYFFTIKQLVPIAIYVIIVAPLSFYYFPLKLIIKDNPRASASVNDKFQIVILNLLFSCILSLSIVHLYLVENRYLTNIIGIMSILSILITIYFFIRSKPNHILLTLIFYSLLAIGITAI